MICGGEGERQCLGVVGLCNQQMEPTKLKPEIRLHSEWLGNFPLPKHKLTSQNTKNKTKGEKHG